MDKKIQQTNFSNHKINSQDQTNKMVVKLGSKKGDKSYDPSPKLTHPHNKLIMSIVDTP